MTLFQSFWHGGDLPKFAKLCLTSFIDHGDRIRLYSYRPLEVPKGVELGDASTILPVERVFYYRNPDGSNSSVSAFANLFRYVLLARHGGWWVDADVLRLDGPCPEEDLHFGCEREGFVCSAILKAPAGHALMREAEARAHAAGTDLEWGATGPRLLTAIVEELGWQALVHPFGRTYRTDYSQYFLATTAAHFKTMEELTEGAPFLHLWHEMFRRTGIDHLNAPEAGSFLASKFKAHGFD